MMLKRSIAGRLDCAHLMAVEFLGMNDPVGLTVADIARAAGVSKSVAAKSVDHLLLRDVIVPVGRRRNARVFRLNTADPSVVDLVRALNQYTVWRAEDEAAKHGVDRRRPRRRHSSQH